MSRSRRTKALFVRYCAADFLGGTQLMSPFDELAYRRIVDLIYHTGDNLPDDDVALAHATKAGDRWPEIKKRLLDTEKIKLVHGRITNDRCRQEIEKVRRKIVKCKASSALAAEARKTSKSNRLSLVGTSIGASNGTSNGSPNHLTSELESKKEPSPKVIDLFGEGVQGEPPPRKRVARQRSAIAAEWRPSQAGIAFMRERAPGADLERQLASFIDHHRAHGKLMADWDAAWRTWCGNIRKFSPPGTVRQPFKAG